MSTSSRPDLKRGPRIRDPELLARLHREWTECVLCDSTGVDERGFWIGLSLEHIHSKPRDDVFPNLAMLCGHGTAGCHGAIEHHDHAKCQEFAQYLVTQRLDTMGYLGEKLGGVNAVREWLNDQLHACL